MQTNSGELCIRTCMSLSCSYQYDDQMEYKYLSMQYIITTQYYCITTLDRAWVQRLKYQIQPTYYK